MSDEPGLARLTYRRLRSAAGVADLAALEGRVDRLEPGVAESRSLDEPLAAAVARVEAALVPVLEARARRADGDATDVP